ncbi:MAG TPA: 4-hydroxy-3-methylbut-2-en-1-yl diphosphate synthase [Candidatus Omnitrophica bacterium]|nr:MAG: 4-hydroxy-3-methylbut-2-en-1-yl diphosphate synthase [Omnitrophica WOR_2 bacterium GWA2_45_18]OGX19287.1 MAG: 4-hydroxy-3-methylbut-2-en-1-yl diphosphate synthase [Omnitrophica WOR_2 bacterium GWC2_45_7]HBR15871.1 4-hydroxy-3-methylbut-2-en-1-yl diphosphate synthase [Candidatus Omnitrophota bacterium]
MALAKRRRTPTVKIGNVLMGSNNPIVIQSMTNTPTSDIRATVKQICELMDAGSEMVRLTVNDDKAAEATPRIIQILRDKGYCAPIIGDFHFNGHLLLNNHPECGRALDKYRINPGNIGKGARHDENFAQIIKIAIEHDKAVRIGVNWGSLDQELFTNRMNQNAKLKKPKSFKEVTYNAMIQSALDSAALAMNFGLKKEKIVLSVKMSHLQDMVNVYSDLAAQCDYTLHLGLTEAGGGLQGVTASTAALAILLQQGIGDTIRVSLTPQPHSSRTEEVEICKNLLQSMGLRYFLPTVTSCPGCGRTKSDYFQELARDIQIYIHQNMPLWKEQYPGVERLTIAVMGCVVNGPGESRYADIGISLPGAFENPSAPVYIDGKASTSLKGNKIKEQFITILEDYIRRKCIQEGESNPR